MPDDKKTVCIFEDNLDIQLLLKIFFVKRGFLPIINGDGVDAVAVVRKHNPAVIMMDIIMPGKDGIEACKELRENGVKTPIVILTSKAFADDKQRGLSAGANAYLFKPFNPADLDATVRPLLG
jgi:DNA-binding response OmpR family regulator